MDALEFALELKDLFSPAALRAEQSVKALESELRKADGELSRFERQLQLANDLGDIAGHRKYSGLVDETKAKIYGLGQQLEATGESAHGLSVGMTEGIVAFEMFGAAIAAAGALAVGAVADIGAELVKTGIEVTEFNESTVAAFDALGAQGEGSGKKTLAFLDDMASKLPQSREQLAKWTKQFEALGITDIGQLRQQIVAAASAQVIMGKGVANTYKEITERINIAVEAHSGLNIASKSLKTLYEAGVNEADIARKMPGHLSVQALNAGLKAGTIDAQAFGNALSNTLVEKGAEPLRVASNEVGVLKAKIAENVHHFFDGLDSTPITDAIRDILTVSDTSEVAGKTLGDAIHDGAQKAIIAVGELITEATVLGINLETAWTKGMTVIDPVIEKMKELGIVSGDVATNVRSVADGFTAAASVAFGAATGGVGGAISAGAAQVLPANDSGGVVQPARGEMLASVAPGEMILPAPAAEALSRPQPANDGASGVTIGTLNLTVQGEAGITDAHQLSVTGLVTAFERLQLAGGR